MADDYSKCENTGDGARNVPDQATCQQRASTAGAPFYSFREDNLKCYYSMSCDRAQSNTNLLENCACLWRRYQFGSEEYEQNCPAPSGLTVWSESRFHGNAAADADGCVHDATWETAVSICASVPGARMCTQQEMAAGCTAGTGCGHDSDMIWTSTPGTGPGVVTVTPPADCHFATCGNPNDPNCVPETCADNSEVHEVRYVLPLCLPSAFPFSHPVSITDYPVSITDHAPLSHAQVRCCSDTESVFGHMKCPDASGLTVWSASVFRGNAAADAQGCVHDATWETAASVCASVPGARLCTQEEMAAGCTKGTGCGHDADMIWTATSDLAGSTGPGR
jgi:hypothetical protein